jgi:LacI family transcriptional regulator
MALPDIHGEFYSALLGGADGEAKKQGYHLLVSSGQGRAMQNDLGLGPLLGLVDGVAVMITEPNEALIKRVTSAGMPMVVLDSAPAGTKLDTIEVDNQAGATAATEHLLRMVPPDRCYFVGGPKDNFDTAERAEAFIRTVTAAARSRGTPVSASAAYGSYSFDWGKARGEQMIADGVLKRGAEGLPVGVLAGNDEIAYGLLHAARGGGDRRAGQARGGGVRRHAPGVTGKAHAVDGAGAPGGGRRDGGAAAGAADQRPGGGADARAADAHAGGAADDAGGVGSAGD